MNSIWHKNLKRPRFKALKEEKRTADTVIIGGGITGILCAYMLKKSGANPLLLEANEICGGITKNTTAKISIHHGLIYGKLIKRFGEEKARKYLEAQIAASEEYSKLCRDIDCGYERRTSFVYSTVNRNKILAETAALKHLGIDAVFSETPRLPIETAGAVRVENQAQFNPLKFAYEIARDLPIYENTKVLQLLPNKIITDFGEIFFDKLIVATHFPIFNNHGSYFLKMYQHRSYVIALEGAANVDGIYIDEDKSGLSFRNYGDYLLLGGGAHRTGKKGGGWAELERFAEKHYKGSKIAYRWATQDCMTLDGAPYIGQYSKATPNLFVATGFNKWGMTNSMAAAIILTDLIGGKKSRYAEVFSPSRSILRPQLAINAFETLSGLLTPCAPRCPHLGCALKYNKAERSWDCSCHGSRFTEDGELIDNPATDDKKM